jgi:carboxyl-terminal processing protease
MNWNMHNLRNLVVGALFGVIVTLGASTLAKEPESEALPLDHLRIFSTIFGVIKSQYVEPVDDVELLDNAIRGMLSGLDPHSTYLVEEDYKALREGTTGEFGGLGIEVGMENGFVKVISPIDDTPAERAGIEAGDLIVRLDEKPVKGMALDEAVDIMRGEPGSEITLTVMRDGVDKPLKITIVRDVIKVVSVRGRVLEEGYLYLRIAQFQVRTTADLLARINKLREEMDGPVKGMVLDLRNNPGGVLDAAVSISDAFLTDGLVVYTQGREEASRQEFHAGPDDVLDGAPLVVLVNEGSASASEIVAGALQDRKRALIMGFPTFGKGSVQSVIPLSGEGVGIKLTTARYYTPSGRSIQAEGIHPDIELSRVKLTALDDGEVKALKERDLEGHLTNDDVEAGQEEGGSANNKSKDDGDEQGSLVERDYVLGEALNLLKGLHIMQVRSTE